MSGKRIAGALLLGVGHGVGRSGDARRVVLELAVLAGRVRGQRAAAAVVLDVDVAGGLVGQTGRTHGEEAGVLVDLDVAVDAVAGAGRRAAEQDRPAVVVDVDVAAGRRLAHASTGRAQLLDVDVLADRDGVHARRAGGVGRVD